MNDAVILWVYIVLLLIGGVIGFVKAKSKASLIASLVFGAILTLFALNILPFAYNWIVLLILAIFFAKRFGQTKKVMPAGFMVLVSVLAIILQFVN